MNASDLTEAIRGFGSAKEIARVAGCSPATAARYRRGETLPDPLSLARLMARSRAIANAMLRLAGLDDLTMDLEEARLRQELNVLQAKRETSHAANSTVAGAAPRPALGLADELADQTRERMTRALDEARRLR